MRRPYYRRPRSTPQGEHVPVMPTQILEALDPKPGMVAVDCTLGFAGHAALLLQRVAPDGLLIAFDLDARARELATAKLSTLGGRFEVVAGNFAGLPQALGEFAPDGCDVLLADLGMSSMQVDDAERGFSFMRDGPLDMRMDPSRGKSVAELLATLSAEDLALAFAELGDEPQAELIAEAIVAQRKSVPLSRTWELSNLIQSAAPVRIERGPDAPTERQQRLRPVARVFQALRMLVNREIANLQALLRSLPTALKPGGKVAILSFHSGEDRLVKAAFKDGLRTGVYAAISEEPLRAGMAERYGNPRSRSAKLRWARRCE